jgi:hypothetical protein
MKMPRLLMMRRVRKVEDVVAMAFVISDFALVSDVQARSRGGQSLRSAPSTMKAPRTRATPRNTVPIYPGLMHRHCGPEERDSGERTMGGASLLAL